MSTLHALFARLLELDRTAQAATLANALRTLDHIHVVDRIFMAHLLGQPHGYSTNLSGASTDGGMI